MIRSVEMVSDQGQIGVLDAGDVFTITFQNPIGGVDAPSSVIRFEASSGASDSLSHPNADFDYTQTRRSVTVFVSDVDIVGDPVDFALPLPATITYFSGVHDRRGNELDGHVSSVCSKDAVLD